MKTTAYTYFQTPPTFPKNSSIAANEAPEVPPQLFLLLQSGNGRLKGRLGRGLGHLAPPGFGDIKSKGNNTHQPGGLPPVVDAAQAR
jgi:hypothetical protein